MTESTVYNIKGKEAGKVKLPEEMFALPWNANLVYETMNTMRTNARQPVAHTKTRGEVRGGGKKPWQQKGTGRARHGSSRSPIWVGGGTTFGPRNEQNYARKLNKKTKSKAFFTILSRKFKGNGIIFIDSLPFAKPKTKDAASFISAIASIKGFEKFGYEKTNTAIIALSANVMADVLDKCVQAGFSNYVTKPVDFKALSTAMGDLLDPATTPQSSSSSSAPLK